MKKHKYTTFVMPELIKHNFIAMVLSSLFFVVGFLISTHVLWLIASLLFDLWIFAIDHNAYGKTFISKDGIANRHISIPWHEIKDYRLLEIDQRGKIPKIKFSTIVCIGDVSTKDFVFCDLRKSVCFSLTRKNLKMIDEMCEEKNETIKELLSWNNFPIKKW